MKLFLTKEVCNFLVKHPLAGADVFDFFVKFVKISGAESGAIFESVAIQHITFVDVAFEDFCCPLPKLDASFRIDTVANRNNCFQ